jgi:translation elongation factor EF-Tu-like GTPase
MVRGIIRKEYIKVGNIAEIVSTNDTKSGKAIAIAGVASMDNKIVDYAYEGNCVALLLKHISKNDVHIVDYIATDNKLRKVV